jgi:hypothetical protein
MTGWPIGNKQGRSTFVNNFWRITDSRGRCGELSEADSLRSSRRSPNGRCSDRLNPQSTAEDGARLGDARFSLNVELPE